MSQPITLADLRTGGAKVGPVVTLCRGSGAGSGSGYGEALARHGIAFTNCSYCEPLTDAFIEKLNSVVVDGLPRIGEEHGVFGMSSWKG